MSSDPQYPALAAARTYGAALTLAGSWLREALLSWRQSSAPDNSSRDGAKEEQDRANDWGETPDLDAQLVLAHVIGMPRFTVLAYPERTLTPGQAIAYADLIARRAAREPLAYLVGHQEFMGLDFVVDRRVLIPRPETELLAEAALHEAQRRLGQGMTPVVADIGTGSGALALALAALEPRLTRVYATDISSDALALARENASRLGVAERVEFLQGDLLIPLPEQIDLLVANLPYVAPRDAATLPPDVRRYEPALALYGADDGLGHLRRLFAQTPERVNPGAALYLEFGYDQRMAIEALAHATFPDARLRVVADYAGWDRFIEILV
ncbi:MAG TPA: peptide chain release factor N(5)-glutamine methyltransferase [Ktedonobacterales bacterium]|nr:peptide chain release factor N(5)-glutamine methyltransferase [Ktedonobacterales bacterium]